MHAASARLALRPSRLSLRRTPVRKASTTSEAANAASSTAIKAKDSAANATSKASEGLSRVTSSASSALSKAGPALSKSLGKIEGRTGRLVSAVQSLIPPTVYYARVSAELSKMVFRGQQMSPPTLAQFRSQFQPLINLLQSPSTIFTQYPGLSQPQRYLSALRNVGRQQLATGAIVLAELVGFFTVGEMLGRWKIVGYRSSGPAHDHH